MAIAGRSGIRFVAACTLAVLLAASAHAAPGLVAAAPGAADPAVPEGFRIERSEERIKVPDGVRIDVTNLFGDVRARYGDADSQLEMLRIVQQFADEGSPIEVQHRLEDDVLRIQVGVRPRQGAGLELQPRPGQRKRAELVLFVPEGAPLHVRTGSGLVQLRGLRSDVVAQSGSGDMQVRSMRGALDLSSDSGDLAVILESTGREQRMRVGTGDLQLSLREEGHYTLTARTRGPVSTDYSLAMGPTGRDGAREARVVLGEGTTPIRVDAGTGFLKVLRKPSAEASFVAPGDGQ